MAQETALVSRTCSASRNLPRDICPVRAGSRSGGGLLCSGKRAEAIWHPPSQDQKVANGDDLGALEKPERQQIALAAGHQNIG